MSILKSNYETILSKISAAAKGRPVTLVAVSKSQPVEKIIELYKLGHRDFGENYAQELHEKIILLDEKGIKDIRWHFIGHLQTNKVRSIIPRVFCIHSVDSDKLIKEISKRVAEAERPPVACFVEVNLSSEQNKSGVIANLVPGLVKTLNDLDGVGICGLMCIPNPDRKDKSSDFKKLKELALVSIGPKPFLSMGMSDDYEVAIENGSTHVRIGTALFGERES
ncbi:MAG: YggS family pyridoxal phosphate-dependent enzyme [Xanthomonadaceae bacterium]|nr:YggS family pyridoxal phosphate-dependent enzyme [Xanthomonadaceae bacterium]